MSEAELPDPVRDELEAVLRTLRPVPPVAWAAELDGRVAARFGRAERPPAARRGGPAAGRRAAWWRGPQLLVAVPAVAVAAVTAVILASAGDGVAPVPQPVVAQPAPGLRTAPGPAVAQPSAASGVATPSAPPASGAATRSAPASAGADHSPGSAVNAPAPAPPAAGRAQIHSATLVLATKADTVEQVAQEAFAVVGSVNGIVDSSTVTQTGGPDGEAHFAVRVPSATLGRAMGALSRLSGATVASRTDASQDVNQQLISAQNALTDARAVRAALLRRLAATSDRATIDALRGRLASTEAAIAAAQAALRGLGRETAYSRIDLTVTAGAGGGAVVPADNRFGVDRAVHDALRVLSVAAGVVIVAAAALAPLALLAALLAVALAALRRHSRLRALDAA